MLGKLWLITRNEINNRQLSNVDKDLFINDKNALTNLKVFTLDNLKTF